MPAKIESYHGKVIHEVIIHDGEFVECNAKVPAKNRLFSFEIRAKGRAWLILDRSGNIELTEYVVDRLWGSDTYRCGYTLAIDKKTGEVFTAHFGTDKKVNFVSLYSLDRYVPKAYLPRLKELKSSSRPFYLTFSAYTCLSLLDREIGFETLLRRVKVVLNFKTNKLILWKSDTYQEVPEEPDWKRISED